MSKEKNLIIISGGFDPLHRGHIAMFKDAAKRGDIVVCLNSDEWLTRKKGKPFMCWEDRFAVVKNLKGVKDVVPMNDDDNTACDGIKQIHKMYAKKYDHLFFAKGGDRNAGTTPSAEQLTCKGLEIEVLWGIGGADKPQSSSKIIKDWEQRYDKKNRRIY